MGKAIKMTREGKSKAASQREAKWNGKENPSEREGGRKSRVV
jgi:hypothetical protein